MYVSAGEWSSPKVTGQPPPPCSFFTLTQVGERKAALFGGLLSGTLNDLFMAELSIHTVVRRKDTNIHVHAGIPHIPHTHTHTHTQTQTQTQTHTHTHCTQLVVE